MGKQMEGDNRERRSRARQAREEDRQPSEEKVTLGASKQRHHLGQREDAARRKAQPAQGKQR